MFKYTIYDMTRAFTEYAKQKRRISMEGKEGFAFGSDENHQGAKETGSILGMAVGYFFIIFFAYIALYIAAIFFLIKNGHQMPTWAIITAIIFLVLPIPGGVIIALLLALLAKSGSGNSRPYSSSRM